MLEVDCAFVAECFVFWFVPCLSTPYTGGQWSLVAVPGPSLGICACKQLRPLNAGTLVKMTSQV